MVPCPGRGGHSEKKCEAGKRTATPTSKRDPQYQPPAAMVHHAHKGSGPNRSSKMPATATISTITNG